MKILILGSNGFFGRAIKNRLKLNKKNKILVLTKSKNFDFTDLNKLEKFYLKNKPEIIINCAGYGGSIHYFAKKPADTLDSVRMYINIYKASDKLTKKPKIINCLANCVYTANQNYQREKKWDDGKVHDSVYTTGNIHRFRYLISRAWNEQHNVKSINLIFGGLYGPGDHLDENRLHAFDGIILRMIKAKKKQEKKFKIYGSGKPIREWIYIDDAAKAIEIATRINQNIIDPINVTNNFSISINKIAKIAKDELGFNGKLFNDKTYIDGDLIKRLAKQSKRYKKYFSKLKFTNLKLSISKTVDYYYDSLKKI